MNVETQKDDLIRATLCDSEEMRGHVYASIQANKKRWMADCIGEEVTLVRSMEYVVSADLDPLDRSITVSIEITGPERVDGRGGPATVTREISTFPISRARNPRAMLIAYFEEMRGMARTASLRVVGVPEDYLVCLDEMYFEGIAENLLKGDGDVRKQMSLILIEDEGGNVSVHIHAESVRARAAFKEMVGKPGDPKIRATLVDLDYDGSSVTVEAKDLPNPKMDEHDAWLLGSGPINFDCPKNRSEPYPESCDYCRMSVCLRCGGCQGEDGSCGNCDFDENGMQR